MVDCLIGELNRIDIELAIQVVQVTDDSDAPIMLCGKFHTMIIH